MTVSMGKQGGRGVIYATGGPHWSKCLDRALVPGDPIPNGIPWSVWREAGWTEAGVASGSRVTSQHANRAIAIMASRKSEGVAE